MVRSQTSDLIRAWPTRIGEVRIGVFEMIGWLLIWYYLPYIPEAVADLLRATVASGLDWSATAFAHHTTAISAGLRTLVTLVMLLYITRMRRHPLRYLGIETPQWHRDLPFTALMALLAGSVFAVLITGIGLVVWVWPELLHAQPGDPIPRVLHGAFGIKQLTWKWFVLTVLLLPVLEEIWFRGWLYPVVRKQFSAPKAIAFSALVFAFAHGWMPLSQLVGGFVFAYAYEKRPNLFVPIVLHMLGNGSLFALSWLVDRAYQ